MGFYDSLLRTEGEPVGLESCIGLPWLSTVVSDGDSEYMRYR